MIKSRKGQEGFTLIELLVVVLIIGILAAIAIPAFLGQKKGAQDSNAKSLLRNAAIAMESFYSENQSFATATDVNLELIEPNMVWQVNADYATALAKNDQVNIDVTDGATATVADDAYTLRTTSASGNIFNYKRGEDASVLKCKGTVVATVDGCTANAW